MSTPPPTNSSPKIPISLSLHSRLDPKTLMISFRGTTTTSNWMMILWLRMVLMWVHLRSTCNRSNWRRITKIIVKIVKVSLIPMGHHWAVLTKIPVRVEDLFNLKILLQRCRLRESRPYTSQILSKRIIWLEKNWCKISYSRWRSSRFSILWLHRSQRMEVNCSTLKRWSTYVT